MAYAAGDILVRAVMQASTGLPEDVIINDFAFKKPAGAPTSLDYSNAAACVDVFYNTAQANTHKVSEYLSPFINRSATHELQAWTIVAGPLGSPDWSDAWIGPDTQAGGTGGLPTEVAGVLSFHAELTGVLEESGATRPRARRRGRVYIGPLMPQCIENSTPFRLDTTFLQTLRQAAVMVHDDAEALDLQWCVWSRTDQVLRPVVGGWTDNAPDTQRRRGASASTRVTFTP